MDNPPAEEDGDPFLDSDEEIAAQARQLFRARRADDQKAVQVEIFYLKHKLTLTLRRHLREKVSLWDGKQRWIDGLGKVKAEYPSPGRLRIQAEATWVVGQELWYDDPFEFELELCPRSGAFRGYVFRFGDHRPLAAKRRGGGAAVPPPGGWAFEFHRSRVESSAAADRPRE